MQRAAYDDDFFLWSQHQAAVLRGLSSAGLPNELDLEHVAEAIGDLGVSELNRVLSHLEGMLIHLIKAASSPDARPVRHWLVEADEHQRHAIRHFTPGMRQRIDVNELWRGALGRAEVALARYDEALAPLPDTCPFELAELLDRKGNTDALHARLTSPAV